MYVSNLYTEGQANLACCDLLNINIYFHAQISPVFTKREVMPADGTIGSIVNISTWSPSFQASLISDARSMHMFESHRQLLCRDVLRTRRSSWV